jgi:hypothetical protein
MNDAGTHHIPTITRHQWLAAWRRSASFTATQPRRPGAGRTFTQVGTGTWAGNARLKTSTVPAMPTKNVTVEATQGLNGSYASAAEVEVPVP